MSTPLYNVDSPYETDLYEYNNFSFIYDAVFEYNENGVEYGGSVNESSITSTLTGELNRLAYGGTYPPISLYLTATKAANVYAGTDGLPLVGALNKAADPNRQPNNYKALGGICNELAGTTGLSPLQALRSIEL
jgi:hypothetical protein